MASLTPRDVNAVLSEHLSNYMVISDEAEITDFELLQIIQSLSNYNQVEDRLVRLDRLFIYYSAAISE
jgi:hypothetical protein